MNPREFYYRIPWQAPGVRPGAHRSRWAGEGQAFRGLVPFLDRPDPRRLDVRASLTDPQQGLWIRTYAQRAAIPVFAIVDVSGSMAYRGRAEKMHVIADFIDGLAASVHRLGDRLGIVAAADRVLTDFSLPPVRWPGSAHRLADRLRAFRPRNAGGRGLLEAAHWIPPRRALVFVLSDFHFPLGLIRELLAALAPHDVVPVVFWEDETRLPGRSGFARMVDLEDGGERLMLLRPALRERLEQGFQDRRERIAEQFRRAGRVPLFLSGGYDADRITAYFQGSPG